MKTNCLNGVRITTSERVIIRAMESPTDEELVARSRLASLSSARKEEFLNELFGRYHARVAVWCYRVTGDRGTAADLAQDVFLKAYRNLDDWEGRSKFSTWLYSVTRNHCLNELAARAIRPEATANPFDFDPIDPNEAPAEERLQLEGDLQQMRELIQTELDRTEARVMTLHYGDEMPLETITRMLRLTNPSGAKAHIVSARRKLRAAVVRLRPFTKPERDHV
jgi:RNA polymerase sigma factor (sigma-70 family)